MSIIKNLKCEYCIKPLGIDIFTPYFSWTVEAGEKLGFLPGDLQEKVDPYLRPLYDALYEVLGSKTVEEYIEKGIIEIAPLAYMRGRTLNNAFILLDEAQNTTPMQMKMFLTRIGENSRMIIVGDSTQRDIFQQPSGFTDAFNRLSMTENIETVILTVKDVVRADIVGKIIEAYEKKLYPTPDSNSVNLVQKVCVAPKLLYCFC